MWYCSLYNRYCLRHLLLVFTPGIYCWYLLLVLLLVFTAGIYCWYLLLVFTPGIGTHSVTISSRMETKEFSSFSAAYANHNSAYLLHQVPITAG